MSRKKVVRLVLQRKDRLANSFEELIHPLLMKVFFDDVDTAESLIRKPHTAFDRRSAFRAFFAAIEGTLFMFKRNVLEASQSRPRLFSQAEVSILLDEIAVLRENGDVVVQPKFHSTAANLRFVAAALVKMNKRFPVLKTDHSSWAAFQRCVKVRNRVVHPKKVADATISDDEIRDLLVADAWFRTWALAVLRICIQRACNPTHCGARSAA